MPEIPHKAKPNSKLLNSGILYLNPFHSFLEIEWSHSTRQGKVKRIEIHLAEHNKEEDKWE